MGFDAGKLINDLLPTVAVAGLAYLGYRLLFPNKPAAGLVGGIGNTLGEGVSNVFENVRETNAQTVSDFRTGFYGYEYDKIIEKGGKKAAGIGNLLNPEGAVIFDALTGKINYEPTRLDLLGVGGPLTGTFVFESIENLPVFQSSQVAYQTANEIRKSTSGRGTGKATVVDGINYVQVGTTPVGAPMYDIRMSAQGIDPFALAAKSTPKTSTPSNPTVSVPSNYSSSGGSSTTSSKHYVDSAGNIRLKSGN